jgi:hypothetical protein
VDLFVTNDARLKSKQVDGIQFIVPLDCVPSLNCTLVSWPSGKTARVLLCREFRDKLNFDAGAEWDLRDAEGASCMLAEVSEDFTEKFGGAIGDEMLLREGRGAIHQHHQFHDSRDLAEITGSRVEHAKQLDGDISGGLLSLRGGEICAEFSSPWPPFFLRNMPGDEDQITCTHERQERGSWWRDGR